LLFWLLSDGNHNTQVIMLSHTTDRSYVDRFDRRCLLMLMR
jgi:hypothetical protein